MSSKREQLSRGPSASRMLREQLLHPPRMILDTLSMTWQTGKAPVAMLQGSKLPHERYAELLPLLIRQTLRDRTRSHLSDGRHRAGQRRSFHDYFVTHLPSSSLHPDSRSAHGLAHKFPRNQSTPHTPTSKTTPAAHPSVSRDTTVVRIPLKSAKHHFGACVSRGSRPYNEDSHQAGVIELPAFAKRPPISVRNKLNEVTSAEGASGDPQVFYFGVFDGHGGAECSDYLRAKLHEYVERSAVEFSLQSSLQIGGAKSAAEPGVEGEEQKKAGQAALEAVEVAKSQSSPSTGSRQGSHGSDSGAPYPGDPPLIQEADQPNIQSLEKTLVQNWRDLVGGYFRRFKPAYFSIYGGYQSLGEESASFQASGKDVKHGAAIEEVITYAFLKADYDFVAAQASREKESRDTTHAERPINDDDHILGRPRQIPENVTKPKRFTGGSTCSVAIVSTPSPTPFWNPATSSSMLVAHVGDTRVLVCSTATGLAIPLTTDHHPSSPVEANRLRRYAATFVTDSFGEERISGLANTRAFGDIGSKRIGVSAEPEIKRIELGAAEYSFMVLMSDGVSGTLSDQEVVDIVKEAKTPEQGARDVVSFATEVSVEGDNATCLVIRLGGWERRQEGGRGSLGTKESRDYKQQDAMDPRNRRR